MAGNTDLERGSLFSEFPELESLTWRKRRLNVVTKSALTLLGQYSHSASVNGLHPGTKQTTISTFFTAQKAGEKNTDQNKELVTSASNNIVHLEGSELLRGKRTTAPASVLQPSGLQDCQTQSAKPPNASRLFLGRSLPAQARSQTSTLRVAREEDAVTDGEACLTTDLIQHLGVKGGLQPPGVPVSPLKEKNGGWQREERPALFSRRSPSFKIIPNQRRTAGKRRRPLSSRAGVTFVDDSDSENMDPDPEENLAGAAHLRDFNQTTSGFCRNYSDAVSYENSSLASTQRLFTQDSEGYRVISHRYGEESKRSSPKELMWGKRTPVRSSFNNKSCFRDGWAGDSSPPGSLGRSFSPLAERSEKSCYDLLFTEDSEGNKVIKH
ncbi:uncharacterized protein LOC120314315 isoform X2 [Crotalus tigris]|uniref:uncharacterized protein LOC120314315 isoform X2 n=1 Tax=Crotalus tigris TaxID=88082 RepID=UPI00192FB2F9|nr:uncharacterized protein LOC120314315 isoform X2 [Crotalus tigris]